MSLDQSDDVTVLGATDQVTLPVAMNGPVFGVCGALSDGDGIRYLATQLHVRSRLARVSQAPLGAQVTNQLFF